MRGSKGSSLLGIFIVSALGAGGALLFQNCQRPVQNVGRLSDANDDIVRAPADATETEVHTFASELEAASAPFAGGKMQIRKVSGVATEKVRQKAGRVILPAGERLIVIVNNECARLHPGAVSSRLYSADKALEGLQTQTYRWILDQPLALEDVDALVNADACVIGLSHDDIMRATALPNDPSLSSQVNFNAIGGPQTYSFFNDSVHGSRATVVVAVIDSGTNYAHDDLKNMLWHNPIIDEQAHNAVGYNFRAENYFPFDDFGHGTFVAGIIAAEANNGVGVTGVMGHDLQIASLKVQSATGEAYISDINRAIDYARSKTVDVINISMEGAGEQTTLLSAMNAAVTAGIVIVSAAGNSGAELNSGNVVVPASYGAQIAGAITVGSVDSITGARSSFSNFSPTLVEIAAPGSNGVYSTDRGGGYSTNQGTSFSAPQVSGAAALTISFFKKHGIPYSPALVESTLMAAAVQNSSLTSSFSGGRTLDLRALAQYLQRKYLSPVEGGFDEN